LSVLEGKVGVFTLRPGFNNSIWAACHPRGFVVMIITFKMGGSSLLHAIMPTRETCFGPPIISLKHPTLFDAVTPPKSWQVCTQTTIRLNSLPIPNKYHYPYPSACEATNIEWLQATSTYPIALAIHQTILLTRHIWREGEGTIYCIHMSMPLTRLT
jgi:hypothetical protein